MNAATISAALLALDDRCDGAVTDDGAGFNGRDTSFGKSLASQVRAGRTLTLGQSTAAAKMLRTYRKQLLGLGIDLDDTTRVDAPTPRINEQAPPVGPAPRVSGPCVGASLAGDLIHISTPFALKDAVKALPGRRWNGDLKVWMLPATPENALALAEVAERHRLPVCFDEPVASLHAAGIALVEQRRATLRADDHALPPLPGKTSAWTHQKRGAAFASPRAGAMLAMDMGTGKTRTALGLLDVWQARTVLILCPVSVVGVWPREFDTHSDRRWNVCAPRKGTIAKKALAIKAALAEHDRLRASTHPDGSAKFRLASQVAIVVNYEAAWQGEFHDLLLSRQWDVVVCDESHRIKGPNGRASKYAATLAKRAAHRLALTGTPTPHSPLDIYAQARFLDPSLFGSSFAQFRNQYAIMGGYENKQIVGYRNEDDLAERMGRFMFQCKAEDVLDLPEAVDVTRSVALEPRALKAYLEMETFFIAELAADDAEESAPLIAANAAVKILRLQQIACGTVRDPETGTETTISTAKRDLLKDVLEDVPADEPVVVFCRFTADLANVRAVASETGRVYAEISGQSKDGLRDDARMADGVTLLGVQIQAGGAGIDLSACSTAVYYSIGHSLGDYLQSRARILRAKMDPRRKRASALYIHLQAEGTVDEVIADALATREDLVEAVLRRAKTASH